MSIFWVGGPEGIIVPTADINTTEEERYFPPGIIHGGGDYIIQVYGWNAGSGPKDERIGVRYLFARDVLEWSAEAAKPTGSFDKEMFEELINEKSEEFVVDNDGSGDFFTLNSLWDKAFPWSFPEVISWAQQKMSKSLSEDDKDKEEKPMNVSELLKDAAAIEYKGILFDDWSIDDESHVWAEICECCVNKYKALILNELDDGSAIGICSVEGCRVSGLESDDTYHYYIDFDPNLIHPLNEKELYKLKTFSSDRKENLEAKIVSASVRSPKNHAAGFVAPDRLQR